MYSSLADFLQRQDCIAILRYAPEEGCLLPPRYLTTTTRSTRFSERHPRATCAIHMDSECCATATPDLGHPCASTTHCRIGSFAEAFVAERLQRSRPKTVGGSNHPVHPPRYNELSSPLVATRRHWDRNTGLWRSEHRTWILQVQIDSLTMVH